MSSFGGWLRPRVRWSTEDWPSRPTAGRTAWHLPRKYWAKTCLNSSCALSWLRALLSWPKGQKAKSIRKRCPNWRLSVYCSVRNWFPNTCCQTLLADVRAFISLLLHWWVCVVVNVLIPYPIAVFVGNQFAHSSHAQGNCPKYFVKVTAGDVGDELYFVASRSKCSKKE